MKLLKYFIGIGLLSLSLPLYASMAGLCNNAALTQYICCPAKGGWIVSASCNSGAATYCVKDTGLISGSNPPITILQDCKNRGGKAVSYPF